MSNTKPTNIEQASNIVRDLASAQHLPLAYALGYATPYTIRAWQKQIIAGKLPRGVIRLADAIIKWSKSR